MDTLRDKLKKNRLGAVAALWATAVATSFALNFSKPNVKTSVKLIHARLHAQAITLAALAAIALVEVYEHKTGEKSEKYKEHVQ
ncbi:hypothetical protein O6H91_03G107700 [Diphasiastrum complanatum]|uniref:Uncharacterized protein n=1 Tax=Diphasiastrum complanatum TaxID=34168 RepID=A0ACC2EAB9_DIPCM|nr:hypothetical protein O6H91_03G107700 [Diphasiastrum complanatum]